MNITLMELHLENFKGISRFTLEPTGKNISVYGNNAAGKTTLFDAWMWLLFNKDSAGKTDPATIKPLDASGNADPAAITSVQAIIFVGDVPVALRKTMAEKWTRKRGSTESEFSGHDFSFYIDEIPCKESDFKAKIANIIPENIFKLICNPLHFNTVLKTDERREMLLTICADALPSSSAVIASHSELEPLSEELSKHSLYDLNAKYADMRSKAIKQRDGIITRIEENAANIPAGFVANAIAALESDIEEYIATINATTIHRDKIGTDEHMAQKQTRIAQIDAEIAQIRATLLQKAGEESEAMRVRMYEKREAISKEQERLASFRRMLAELESSERDEMARAEKRRVEYAAEAAKVFTPPDIDDICPTCGSLFPAEKADEIIGKAREAFNIAKVNTLDTIRKFGIAAKQGAQDARDKVISYLKSIDEVEKSIERLNQEHEALKVEMNNTHAASSEQSTITALLTEKTALEATMSDSGGDHSEEIEAINQVISKFRDELHDTQVKAEAHRAAAKASERVAQLKAELAAVKDTITTAEQKQMLLGEYTAALSDMIESAVSGKFRFARFKLFKKLANGGIEDCCDTTKDGIPFNALNNAAKIQVGFDIIHTLSAHFGVSAPIWVDNNESVTSLPETEAQTIGLFVSAQDNVLRVAM